MIVTTNDEIAKYAAIAFVVMLDNLDIKIANEGVVMVYKNLLKDLEKNNSLKGSAEQFDKQMNKWL